MSTAGRLISGSAAGWVRIIITVISQVILVPIYLTYWNAETYGVWIAIQSLVIMLTLFDLGHHTFVGYELLRLIQIDKVKFCKYLWSALLVGVFVALLELLIILTLIHFSVVPFLVGESGGMEATLAMESGYVLLFSGLNWIATSAFTGYFVRCLEAFGHHARLAWWGVMHLIASSLLPAIAVVFGASFLQAGVVLLIGSIVFYIPVYRDMYRLMKRERVSFIKPSWKIGVQNFLLSTGVTGKLILENLRQQGVRLILAPISGAVALAAFSTMRTGANVALQGLNSIINPLMPDLMRFLHGRDQVRSEAGFGTIWVVVVGLISPAVIVLQGIAPPLFELWTKGQIAFNPLLFALLSMSVLIYAVAQPAIAVVIGNNLMKPRLTLSAVSAGIVTFLVIVLVPAIGLTGAGIALVVSEMSAAIGYVLTAKVWLRSNELRWPAKSFYRALAAITISSISMIGVAIAPHFTWIIVCIGVVLCFWNFIYYWSTLPAPVRERFHQIRHTYTRKIRNLIG